MHPSASRLFPDTVLPAVAFLTLPLAVFAPLMLTWLALLAALTTIPALLTSERTRLRVHPVLVTLAVALLGWAAASSLWSTAPEHSQQKAVELVIFTLGGTALLLAARGATPQSRKRTAFALCTGLAITLAVLVLEISTRGAVQNLLDGVDGERLSYLSHLNRSASVLAIFVWIPLAFAWDRRSTMVSVGLVVLSFPVLLYLDPTTPLVAFVFASLVLILASWRPGAGALLIVAVAILGTAGAPWAESITSAVSSIASAFAVTDSTILHRFDIWAFAGERIQDRPMIGWGLDASRAVPGGEALVERSTEAVINLRATKLPLHPHSATLQLWLELGLPGVLLATTIVVLGFLSAARAQAQRFKRAGILAAATAGFVIAEMSYGIWQGWWLASLWILAAFAVFALTGARPEPDKDSPGVATQISG